LYKGTNPKERPPVPRWYSKGVKQRTHTVTETNGEVFVKLSMQPGWIESDYYQGEKGKAERAKSEAAESETLITEDDSWGLLLSVFFIFFLFLHSLISFTWLTLSSGPFRIFKKQRNMATWIMFCFLKSSELNKLFCGWISITFSVCWYWKAEWDVCPRSSSASSSHILCKLRINWWGLHWSVRSLKWISVYVKKNKKITQQQRLCYPCLFPSGTQRSVWYVSRPNRDMRNCLIKGKVKFCCYHYSWYNAVEYFKYIWYIYSGI